MGEYTFGHDCRGSAFISCNIPHNWIHIELKFASIFLEKYRYGLYFTFSLLNFILIINFDFVSVRLSINTNCATKILWKTSKCQISTSTIKVQHLHYTNQVSSNEYCSNIFLVRFSITNPENRSSIKKCQIFGI